MKQSEGEESDALVNAVQIEFNLNLHGISSSQLWTLLSCTISSNSSSLVRISSHLQCSQSW